MKKVTKNTASENVNNMVNVSVENIQPSNFNPRKKFVEAELHELSESIKAQGILQPVTLRPTSEQGKYEIVCGERRYRASLLAGLKEIPAVIRELSDAEATEIAITENLQRKDVTPIEEAHAYQQLIDTQNYDIAALAARFGKSESYIHSRLKFIALIPEIADLLEADEITASVASEICKYEPEIQTEVYEKHLANEGSYGCWRGLKASEVAKRIKDNYTTSLFQYKFDKSVCAICQHNTNTFRLFVESNDCGNCMNKTCLRDKNKAYIVGKAVGIQQQQPEVQLCFGEYGTNEEAVQMLLDAGYEVDKVINSKPFPRSPKEPDKAKFTDMEKYEEAKICYEEEWADYMEETESLQQRSNNGEIAIYAKIGNIDIEYCYVQRTAQEQQQQAPNPLEALEKKDTRNKEIAREKTVEDTKKLVREADITKGKFTSEEEKMLYFFMLSHLKREHFSMVGASDDGYFLSDEQKLSIIENLTKEAKNIIRRDFLVAHFRDAYGNNTVAGLLLTFTRLHLSEELQTIESTHNEVYEKRHSKIEEKKAVLLVQEQAKERVITQPEAQEETLSEEIHHPEEVAA